jgi:hypothetical protein
MCNSESPSVLIDITYHPIGTEMESARGKKGRLQRSGISNKECPGSGGIGAASQWLPSRGRRYEGKDRQGNMDDAVLRFVKHGAAAGKHQIVPGSRTLGTLRDPRPEDFAGPGNVAVARLESSRARWSPPARASRRSVNSVLSLNRRSLRPVRGNGVCAVANLSAP